MTPSATYPKPEAIASGAATGLRHPGRAPKARPAPAPRVAGAFAPTGAGAVRAQSLGFADTPLARPCARANRAGERSAGPFPNGPLTRGVGR